MTNTRARTAPMLCAHLCCCDYALDNSGVRRYRVRGRRKRDHGCGSISGAVSARRCGSGHHSSTGARSDGFDGAAGREHSPCTVAARDAARHFIATGSIARSGLCRAESGQKISGLAPNDPQLNAQWALQNIQAMQAWGVAPDGFLASAVAETGRVRVAVLDHGCGLHPSGFRERGRELHRYGCRRAIELVDEQSILRDASRERPVRGVTISATARTWPALSRLPRITARALRVWISGGDSGLQGARFDRIRRRRQVSQAIVDAANNGASVISLSLGAPGYSQTLQSAINYAWQKNTLVVAAAGNNSSSGLFFPAGRQLRHRSGGHRHQRCAGRFLQFRTCCRCRRAGSQHCFDGSDLCDADRRDWICASYRARLWRLRMFRRKRE